MNPITVKELHDACVKLILKGHGSKFVMLCDDDEGNGYHSCWYLPNYDPKNNKSLIQEGMMHDSFKPEEFVTLG